MVLLAALLAAFAADGSAPSRPPALEPVYDLATRDLRHLRNARADQVLAVAWCGAFMAGGFAVSRLGPDGEGERESGLQQVAATTLFAAGGAAMAVFPIALRHQAWKSRKLLQEQGLQVRGTPPVVMPLAITGILVASGGFMASKLQEVPAYRRGEVATGPIAVGMTLYMVSVGVGTLQLDMNRRARRSAGWLGVSPLPVRDGAGMAVAVAW